MSSNPAAIFSREDLKFFLDFNRIPNAIFGTRSETVYVPTPSSTCSDESLDSLPSEFTDDYCDHCRDGFRSENNHSYYSTDTGCSCTPHSSFRSKSSLESSSTHSSCMSTRSNSQRSDIFASFSSRSSVDEGCIGVIVPTRYIDGNGGGGDFLGGRKRSKLSQFFGKLFRGKKRDSVASIASDCSSVISHVDSAYSDDGGDDEDEDEDVKDGIIESLKSRTYNLNNLNLGVRGPVLGAPNLQPDSFGVNGSGWDSLEASNIQLKNLQRKIETIEEKSRELERSSYEISSAGERKKKKKKKNRSRRRGKDNRRRKFKVSLTRSYKKLLSKLKKKKKNDDDDVYV